jgi:hypothetical protein
MTFVALEMVAKRGKSNISEVIKRNEMKFSTVSAAKQTFSDVYVVVIATH